MWPARPLHRALVIAALGAALLASTRHHWIGLGRRLTRRHRALAAVARVAGADAAGDHDVGSLAELSMALTRPGQARDLTIEHLADRAADDARALGDLILAQRPPALDGQGLAGALADLATWFADVHGLDCAAQLALGGELAPDLESAAYRAAESLMGAAAEGGVGRARLLVAGDADQVVVELAAGAELLSVTLVPDPVDETVKEGLA